MNISVEISPEQYSELERLLADAPQNVDRAAAGAINRTVATGATRIRRELARISKMPVRKFGNRVRAIKTNPDQLSGRIRLLNFNIPMIDTRQIPVKGGNYPLEKLDLIRTLTNTPFVQKMKSGHEGWFVRFGPKRVMKNGRYAGKMREPIKQVFALAPRKLWEDTPGLAARQLSELGDVLEKNLASQVDRFLK